MALASSTSWAATAWNATNGFGLLSLAAEAVGSWMNKGVPSKIAMDIDIENVYGDEIESWETYGNHLRRLTSPSATEFLVNDGFTSGMQITPAIAALTGGGFVIVWSSDGYDGSYYGIHAVRYGSNGNRHHPLFLVNTATDHDQSHARVAGLKNGDFVIVWMSYGTDGSSYGVYVQRFTGLGVGVGSNFRVNTYTHNQQRFPDIAGLNDGGFVIVWESYGQDDGIYAQRYDSSGAAYGTEFHVNTYLPDYQSRPAVAALQDGGYIVVWHSYSQDGSGIGVYAQRYTSSNAQYGTEFRVNSYASGDQVYARVAALSNGGYVIVWQSASQDGSGYGIYGRKFTASNAGSDEFRVNSYTSSDQEHPDVIGIAGGGFVVTWQSSGQDGSSYGVFAQRYFADGLVKYGSEFQVNSYTNSDQKFPNAAALVNGALVITWESYAQDGSGTGIYGKLYSSNYFTQAPTPAPTRSPTPYPSALPTRSPTPLPTSSPTFAPTFVPSFAPTPTPTVTPTKKPTFLPTASPTPYPTLAPSSHPTPDPTPFPSVAPTFTPTISATHSPTRQAFELVKDSKFTVNDASLTRPRSHAAISGLSGGGFVVTWDYFRFDSFDVFARVFNEQ